MRRSIMSFTNRWICAIESSNTIDPKDILSKNKVINKEEGEKFPLYKVVVLGPSIVSETNEIEYLEGKLYYQREFSVIDYEIESIENGDDIQIRETNRVVRKTYTIDFWMSLKLDQNYILFKNSRMKEDGLIELSRTLFGRSNGIKPVNFLVERMEKDLKDGNISGSIWGLSFKGRTGSVNSGTMYGEEIDPDDDLYDEVSNVNI